MQVGNIYVLVSCMMKINFFLPLKTQERSQEEKWNLICSHHVGYNEHIAKGNQPEGLVKSKASEDVSWRVIPESSIAKATT